MAKEKFNCCLIAVGGGEIAEVSEIVEEFVEFAGGKSKARIGIMMAATEEPRSVGAKYRRLFQNFGVKEINTIDVSQREDAFNKSALKKIEAAT